MISFKVPLLEFSRGGSHEFLAGSDPPRKKLTHTAREIAKRKRVPKEKNAIENNLKLHSLNQLQAAVSPHEACVWS